MLTAYERISNISPTVLKLFELDINLMKIKCSVCPKETFQKATQIDELLKTRKVDENVSSEFKKICKA